MSWKPIKNFLTCWYQYVGHPMSGEVRYPPRSACMNPGGVLDTCAAHEPFKPTINSQTQCMMLLKCNTVLEGQADINRPWHVEIKRPWRLQINQGRQWFSVGCRYVEVLWWESVCWGVLQAPLLENRNKFVGFTTFLLHVFDRSEIHIQDVGDSWITFYYCWILVSKMIRNDVLTISNNGTWTFKHFQKCFPKLQT